MNFAYEVGRFSVDQTGQDWPGREGSRTNTNLLTIPETTLIYQAGSGGPEETLVVQSDYSEDSREVSKMIDCE